MFGADNLMSRKLVTMMKLSALDKTGNILQAVIQHYTI